MPGYSRNSEWEKRTQALPTDRSLVGKALCDEKAFRKLTRSYRTAILGYLEWFLTRHKLAPDAAAAQAGEMIWQELTVRLAAKLAEKWGKGGTSFRELLGEGIHEAYYAWSKPATRSLMAGQPGHEQEMNVRMRQQILDKAWDRLRSYQRENEAKGNVYFAVLRLWDDHRDESLDALKVRLSLLPGGRMLEAAAFRQTLGRARNLFSRYLCDEVAHLIKKSEGFRREDFIQACDDFDLIDDHLDGTKYYRQMTGTEGDWPTDETAQP